MRRDYEDDTLVFPSEPTLRTLVSKHLGGVLSKYSALIEFDPTSTSPGKVVYLFEDIDQGSVYLAADDTVTERIIQQEFNL